MFHNKAMSRIEFTSNPPIDSFPVIELEIDENGDPQDRIVHKPGMAAPSLKGAHYDRRTMSLAARLQLGIPIEKVNIGCTENDPNVLYRSVNRFVSQVDQARSDRAAAAAAEQAAAARAAAAGVNPDTL